MKHIASPGELRAGFAAWLVGLAVGGPVGPVGPVAAQTLPLPPLGINVTPDTKRMTIDWDEAADTAGRRVSSVVYAPWDSAGSSTVSLVGSFAKACDYRLRIAKIPQDPGLNTRTQLIYQIFDNTTGTGAPLRQDTLRVFAPDSVHLFEASIIGNLGVVVSPNVGSPSGPLGTVPLTLRGVNSTLSLSAGYFVTALNSVTSLSQGLQVQVTGPVDLSAIPDPIPPQVPNDTLLVTSSTEVFPIMDAMTISFGEGSAAPGDTATWTAHYLFPPNGRITADLEAFEGYHVWRSDLPDLDVFELLGEIRQCESKFDFVLLNEDESNEIDLELRYDPTRRHFTVIDLDIHDDFPYRYAVSTFDRGFLGNTEGLTFEGALATTAKIYPARPTRDRGEKAFVVPNPFKRSSDFQEGGPKVVFANLPTACTIRIYNESVEHLITLNHGPGESRSTSPTSREWDLRTDSGQPIVSGIYIFHVEGTNTFQRPIPGGTETVNEAIEQVGKFIVAR